MRTVVSFKLEILKDKRLHILNAYDTVNHPISLPQKAQIVQRLYPYVLEILQNLCSRASISTDIK